MTGAEIAPDDEGARANSSGSTGEAMRIAMAVLTCLVLPHGATAAEPVVGTASVIDGDTIEIGGQRIQLNGVDAPEKWHVCLDESGADYRCGAESASALAAFLSASRPTRCEFVGRDRHGRPKGTCFRADGMDVNRWLVETGNAVDRETHGNGLYASAQEIARSAGAGIWRGQIDSGSR
ncbi:succinoglycan biosynthesis protein exoi [Sinorhizobium saheli]|nr:succinoglycan biosynthesis protein exoi [Sinorhizobium saheli]